MGGKFKFLDDYHITRLGVHLSPHSVSCSRVCWFLLPAVVFLSVPCVVAAQVSAPSIGSVSKLTADFFASRGVQQVVLYVCNEAGT